MAIDTSPGIGALLARIRKNRRRLVSHRRKGPRMWRSLSYLANLIAAINKLEETMGTVADQLAGVREQLEKIKNEIANAGQLDAADRDTLQAVKDGINAIDEMNPDTPTPSEPTA